MTATADTDREVRHPIPILDHTGDAYGTVDDWHVGKRAYPFASWAHLDALSLASRLHDSEADRPDAIVLYRCAECHSIHVGTRGGDREARVARRARRVGAVPGQREPAAEKAARVAAHEERMAALQRAARFRRIAKAARHFRAMREEREKRAGWSAWLDDGGACHPEHDLYR